MVALVRRRLGTPGRHDPHDEGDERQTTEQQAELCSRLGPSWTHRSIGRCHRFEPFMPNGFSASTDMPTRMRFVVGSSYSTTDEIAHDLRYCRVEADHVHHS